MQIYFICMMDQLKSIYKYKRNDVIISIMIINDLYNMNDHIINAEALQKSKYIFIKI